MEAHVSRNILIMGTLAATLAACAPSHHATQTYGGEIVKSRYGDESCVSVQQCAPIAFAPAHVLRPAPQFYVPPPILMQSPPPAYVPPAIDMTPAPIVETLPPAPTYAPYDDPTLPVPFPEVPLLPETPSWTPTPPGDAEAWPEPSRPPSYEIPRK